MHLFEKLLICFVVWGGRYPLGRSHRCLQGSLRVELNSFIPLQMPSGRDPRGPWVRFCYLDNESKGSFHLPLFDGLPS